MAGPNLRDATAADAESIRLFLCANGWSHRLGDAAWFAALLAASQRTAVAECDGQIVGFARGITDGLSNGYLSMVVVAPAHRGRGIGRALVRHVTGDDPAVTWVLRAGREGAERFFSKLGFTMSASAMERKRATPP
jgi:GNAT superfamily N-acetyltransferase